MLTGKGQLYIIPGNARKHERGFVSRWVRGFIFAVTGSLGPMGWAIAHIKVWKVSRLVHQ